MYKLGLDLGSSSCKIVLLDSSGSVVYKKYRMHGNKLQKVLSEMLEDLKSITGSDPVSVCVCGNMSKLTELPEEAIYNEVLAISAGQEMLCPAAGSIVVLGAQKTYYIIKQEGKEPKIFRNSNCSAGTGSFFEEQAGRIGVKLEDISDLIDKATTIPSIAGRCSVFSKTDMIHKMQEGVSTENILNGLCYALVRNFKSNVLRNREIHYPVLLAGGVMKNRGVVNALIDVMKFPDGSYILDENADYYGAAGCASIASYEIKIDTLIENLSTNEKIITKSSYEPLAKFRSDEDVFSFEAEGFLPGDAYLGIDVGSTSINLALINGDRKVMYYSYVHNYGNPLEIVKNEIAKLEAVLPETTKIVGKAVTGSGRERIAQKIGADVAINEITAQTEGAVISHPETDTIFEIGGQDSKYMKVRNQKMDDFEMNKVCAAGTGAFLEEQIKKLGLTMEEFMKNALSGENPCELGNRCTVFIESSITKAIANEYSMPDICAGLAYAIAENYLHRVVNQKPVGDHIALQGGIAYNEAVVCAFRAITGKKVHQTNYYSVTGAIGVASLLMKGSVLKFDKVKNREANAKLMEGSHASYLKGYKPPKHTNGKVIGMPRALYLHMAFPMFRGICEGLGYQVLLSPETNDEIVKLAQEYCLEDVCYPVKLMVGHVAWLLKQNVDYIFLPRIYTLAHPGSEAKRDYGCMYMQTSPLVMEQNFHFKDRGVKLISPQLSLQHGILYMGKNIFGIAKELGRPEPLMLPAMLRGVGAFVEHIRNLVTLGKGVRDDVEPIFVLITRPYNSMDAVLNMGIYNYLNNMGCRVIFLEHLSEALIMKTGKKYADVCWPFGQHILTGIKVVKEHKNYYPIYITDNSCGPDTALQHYIKEELANKEYLHLEVDEHTSKIGVITRLEAFLYSLKPQDMTPAPEYIPDRSLPKVALIPDLGDFTDLVLNRVEPGIPVVKCEPLKSHKAYNYAINSEYYSLIVTLEEVLNTVRSYPDSKNILWELYIPNDQGSEVSGQYAHLIYQELIHLGYNAELHTHFIEEIACDENYETMYFEIIKRDILALLPEALRSEIAEKAEAETVLTGTTESRLIYIRKLALAVRDVIVNNGKRNIIVMGEPLCVYKPGIRKPNLKALGDDNNFLLMPLSEALLFEGLENRKVNKADEQYDIWHRYHDVAADVLSELDVFTDFDKLESAVEDKIEFMIGGFARYRFAKILTLDPSRTDGALIIQSSDEDSARILKIFHDGYDNEIKVPKCYVDVDAEHSLTRDDAIPFLSASSKRLKK